MNRFFSIIVILFLISSCDVLNVEPESSIPASAAFKNKAGIERGILGSYNSLQSLSYYGRAYLIASDLSADNLTHPPDATNSDYAEIDNNAMLPENGAVSGIWASIFDGINVANNVIAKIPGIPDMTETEKNAALGELYFLRALNHFNLLNYFGAIPVKTEPTVGVTNLNAPRDSVDVVYSRIIADLTFAELNLTASTSRKIRATKFAATALLARVALYQGDYDLAYQKANKVIMEGGYILPGDFSSVFSADGSSETIFEIDFTSVDRNRIAEYNFPKSLNGRREVAPDESIITAFEPGDERKNVSIAFDGPNAYANKYNDLSLGADNVIVLRLAEMFLIRAEAATNLTDGSVESIAAACADVDTIRGRANLNPIVANNKTELLNAIETERRAEFAFEGHRWFDLVRTGRAVDLIPTVSNSKKTLFPIPSGELQTNTNPGMFQNPGYL